MHDTLIRGGSIFDGAGGEAFTGDVAVKDGVIVQAFAHETWFAPVSGPARPLTWKSDFPIPQLEIGRAHV